MLRTDGICEAQRTGGLDASTDVLDRGARVADEPRAVVDAGEEAAGEHLEAGDDALAGKLVDALHGALVGHLHLQRALAKAESQRLAHEGLHLRFEDDVVARDADVDVALTDEGGYVGRGEEDAGWSWFFVGCDSVWGYLQCNVMVLHQADVESIGTIELDVRTYLKRACRQTCVERWHSRIKRTTHQQGAQDISREDGL